MDGSKTGNRKYSSEEKCLERQCYESSSAGESSSGKTSQKFPLMWALKDERALVGGRAYMYYTKPFGKTL